jgi:hypothetical protein
VHQLPPHHLTRDAEELAAALPPDSAQIDQPHQDFEDDCGRLQRVLASLASKLGGWLRRSS